MEKSAEEKMLCGERYFAGDKALLDKLYVTKDLLMEYNAIRPSDLEARRALLQKLLGRMGKNALFIQPFYCDYGSNIEVGDEFIANYNFTVLDEALVRIGHHVFIGPNVGIYTACHPLEIPERNADIEWAEPVTIGDSVWIGGGVTICPGVTIGEGAVIGAGSVVVKDIPAHTLAVGNPARVIRKI
jgi:maltose O-acetyltransferase